jgi:hypothetical protein
VDRTPDIVNFYLVCDHLGVFAGFIELLFEGFFEFDHGRYHEFGDKTDEKEKYNDLRLRLRIEATS